MLGEFHLNELIFKSKKKRSIRLVGVGGNKNNQGQVPGSGDGIRLRSCLAFEGPWDPLHGLCKDPQLQASATFCPLEPPWQPFFLFSFGFLEFFIEDRPFAFAGRYQGYNLKSEQQCWGNRSCVAA